MGEKGARTKSGPKRPVRTCAACREALDPSSQDGGGLVRWVVDEQGRVFPDLGSRSFGRGAWLHPTPTCVAKVSTALARSFKRPILTTADEAFSLLRCAAAQRAMMLLGAGKRQRLLAVGSQAVVDALHEGRAFCVIVAKDSGAAARLGAVQEAVRRGLATGFSTKDELGRLLGRPEVAVIAVLDERLAQSLFGAIAMALLAPPGGAGRASFRGADDPEGTTPGEEELTEAK